MSIKFDFSIDWLEFTYRAPECPNGFSVFENFLRDFPEFIKYFESDQMFLLGKGRNFYNMVYCFSDDYTVSYHSEKRNMGVHVTFPGHGIYKISEIFGLGDLNEHEAARKLFKILDEHNCEITRLDLAYDDFTKTFKPHDFEVWRIQERIVSDSRRMSYITSGTGCGDTFYLGKRGRDRFIRIYDKEYESDGKIKAIRYEFELKQDWSRVVQNHIINDKKFCFADLLDSMFTIKEDWGFNYNYDTYINCKGQEAYTLFKNDAMKKSRAAVDEKWQLFLETMRKTIDDATVEVVLPKKKVDYSYKRLYNWLRDYIVPSLFMFKEMCTDDEFNEFIASGSDRLSPMQRSLLKKFIKEKEADTYKPLVYALPVLRIEDDLHDVIDENNEVIFTGSYDDCCILIEEFEETGHCFY